MPPPIQVKGVYRETLNKPTPRSQPQQVKEVESHCQVQMFLSLNPPVNILTQSVKLCNPPKVANVVIVTVFSIRVALSRNAFSRRHEFT